MIRAESERQLERNADDRACDEREKYEQPVFSCVRAYVYAFLCIRISIYVEPIWGESAVGSLNSSNRV